MTYIGNAPNFLVLAMATQGGVHMPGFFGYLGWACVLLLPLFSLVTMLFFI
jgi:Na+/H+ antiporter NhaD/arsenite permease-like protein